MIDQKKIDEELMKEKFRTDVLDKDLSEFEIDFSILNKNDSEARIRSKETIDQLINRYGNDCTVRMCAYMNAILAWNERLNLTAVDNRDDFLQKNIVDSLSVNDVYEFTSSTRVLDLGTGAGLPGIPLAITNKNSQFVLVDAVRKKLAVVNEIAEDLSLSNVEVIHGRAEDLARMDEMRESFDLCVTRAVAAVNIIAEWCLPFVKTGGLMIAYKGEKAEEECRAGQKAVKILGGEIEKIIPVHSDDPSMTMHQLVLIRKVKPSPAKYPRKAGTTRKTPIR